MAPPERTQFTIAELVARTGVPATSVHHYRRLGLIPEPERAAANRFLYDARHEQALQLIRLLRERQRLPLDRIAELLPELLSDDDDAFTPTMWEQAAEEVQVDAGAKLIDVAVDAFADHGYSEVSVADICERAGVAKGTFYRHFDSKDQLFVTAVETVVDRAADDFAAEVAATGDTANPAARFAAHLQPGLPVLLELAKRAVQGQPEHTEVAQRLFRRLADRLGETLEADHLVGGALILDAVATVFAEGIMEAGHWT